MIRIVLVIISTLSLVIPLDAKALTIGCLADIHAGPQTEKDLRSEAPGNIYYPKKYKTAFPEALSQMKGKGAEVVIALGDNFHIFRSATRNRKTRSFEAKSMLQTVKGQELKMLWVRGNHDRDRSIDYLMSKRYYHKDFDSWRIVILDTTEVDPEGVGGIKEAQLNWLRKTLDTNKKVLVAMHHPMLERKNTDNLYSNYQTLEDLFLDKGNVKYVLAGHYHTNNWSKERKGIKYIGVSALTLKGGQDNYKVLNLD